MKLLVLYMARLSWDMGVVSALMEASFPGVFQQFACAVVLVGWHCDVHRGVTQLQDVQRMV